MKRVGKALAALLAGALTLGLAPAALAADETPADKEEVVYINLDSSGAVETVDVVNIFELSEAGQIVDHGDYESVRNMTTTDPLTLSDGTVTAQAGPGRLYYEGRLAGAESPWNVSLRYFLDGEERPAAELAGASGELQIHMTVEKNPDCAGTFFEDHALQASFTLDADRCADIAAPGATVANVGGDRQLTYTILPGMGADVTVTARVTDFEMEPVALNGVRLALSLRLEDASLTERLGRVSAAVGSLNTGLSQLEDGLGALDGQSETLTGASARTLAALQALCQAAGELDGSDPDAAALQAQLDALAEDYAALDTALQSYAQAVEDAYGGSVELGGDAGWLATGAALLSALAPTLDTGELGDVLDSVSGGTGKTASFASPENGDVGSVQFVLRTPAIQKPAPEPSEPEPEQTLTFWEKLAALF